MDDYPRVTINRGPIVLLSSQPLLDWIKRIDPNPPELVLEELRPKQNGFLVSQRKIEIVEDAQRWIYRRWEMFFERQLHEWSGIPTNRGGHRSAV